MVTESTISAYNKVLANFRFKNPSSYSERFAQERFKKKFQVPAEGLVDELTQKSWDTYLSTDRRLGQFQKPHRYHPMWYRVRDYLHKNLVLSLSDFSFPNQSSYTPTRGLNSLESRLSRNAWTCTFDNFGLFTEMCYKHRGLKYAAKKRFSAWFEKKFPGECLRDANDLLFEHFKQTARPGFNIFSWKLSQIVTFTQGSRWSTVPKNNDSRRPINLEPFANIITQTWIGNGLRRAHKELFGLDLDHLAQVHRKRISEVGVATIDLKNASDSISNSLCNFLLPKKVMALLQKSRSPFVLGHDKNYHELNKISSMGNGFTFELMSLILNTVCRLLDPTASVFGDDIIIAKDKAPLLIEVLESTGLQVNKEKSFLEGPFRESCGGNYHDEEGYIKSFDFLYCHTILDCTLALNKALYLSKYESFRYLYQSLKRVTPKCFHGGEDKNFTSIDPISLLNCRDEELKYNSDDIVPSIPPVFLTGSYKEPLKNGKVLDYINESYQLEGRVFISPAFKLVNRLRSPSYSHLRSSSWAKYFMYLASGRIAKDEISGSGTIRMYNTITNGSFRANLKGVIAAVRQFD